MNSVAVILAGLALALPAGAGGDPSGHRARLLGADHASDQAEIALKQPYAEAFQQIEPERHEQVRIERRVIIRVAPARNVRPDVLMNAESGDRTATRFREQPMKRCVPLSNIAGVQSGPENRLILFMRDRHIVSAALEKACSAREFYSGFYVERSDDGLLCSGRDMLQSRTGASCGVQRLAHVVAVKE